jgi:hypothetical protein
VARDHSRKPSLAPAPIVVAALIIVVALHLDRRRQAPAAVA